MYYETGSSSERWPVKPVKARAKRHTTILHPLSGSGSDVIFRAEGADGGPVSGRIEERRKGLFGHKSKLHDLKPENSFRIGTLTNGYRLSVIPDQDVTITFLTSHWQVRDLLKWAAIIFGGMIALSVVMNLLGFAPPPKE